MGVVRKRDLETHASRLDIAKYADYINRSANHEDEAFIVYGGGIVESFVARMLYDNGINVYYCSRLPHTPDVDLRLDDAQISSLPNYLKDRLNSIVNQIKSHDSSDVARNLLRGIPTVDLSDIKTENHPAKSKTYLTSKNKKYFIAGIFSNDFDGLETLDLVTDVYCLLGQTSDSQQQITELPSCLWQVVEFIWPLCVVENKSNYAVQKKLV